MKNPAPPHENGCHKKSKIKIFSCYAMGGLDSPQEMERNVGGRGSGLATRWVWDIQSRRKVLDRKQAGKKTLYDECTYVH